MLPVLSPPRFAPGGGAAWASPWVMYAGLRDHDPVHHVVPDDRPHEDYFVLTRHEDVLRAAVDTATFSSALGLTVEYGELEKIGLADNPPMVMLDPPEHTAFRKLVSRGFTPRAVREVEPEVRAYVAEKLDGFVAAGGGDIVVELFKPLPSMVVAHYLGVPAEDRDRFDGWTDAIVAASSAGHPTEAADATTEMLGYFSELIERRRREPAQDRGSDTVSHLVAAGVGDDDAGLLSILGYVFAMVTGGNDTTTGALGGAVQLLAERPDQRALLVADPTLVKDAVEEFLRLTSPVQGLARTATRDVELHDVTIPAGRKVLLCYGAANRDPRKYGADAERLDVRRQPDPDPHLQPGQPPLHRQRGRADDGPSGARGAARPHPVVHRRPRRCHLGSRPLRPPPPDGAVGADVKTTPRRSSSPPLRSSAEQRRGDPGRTSWLAEDRSKLAAEKILDAAGGLFAEHGIGTVSMGDVAKAAGCSRATLYRYFADRHELHVAYVHREARRVGGLVAADASRVRDPEQQLVTTILSAVRRVREAPALSAWFAGGDAAATAELAQSSPVIEALGRNLGADPLAARWVVRVIVSLLIAPGRDAAEERAIVERFVVPALLTPAGS